MTTRWGRSLSASGIRLPLVGAAALAGQRQQRRLSASGAYGQHIHVNPAEQVVAAIQSAWRQPRDGDAEAETVALLRAAVCALRPDPGS